MKTQATVMMVAHGGADGGRSLGRGVIPTAAEQVVVEPEEATESQRARVRPKI